MQGGAFSYVLLAGLAIALLVAAVTDWRRRQIDNSLNLAIALAAPLWWWASGMSLVAIGWQVGLAVVVFAVAALLFALRQMGGGDVKLLTALALWIAPASFLKLCVVMALIGAAMSVVPAAFNMRIEDGEAVRRRFAYVAAAIWVLFTGYALYVVTGGTPLPLSATVANNSGPVPPLFAVIAVFGSLFALMIGGSLFIVRRQKKRLPVPYGLAISAAGLWLLATTYFPLLSSASQAG